MSRIVAAGSIRRASVAQQVARASSDSRELRVDFGACGCEQFVDEFFQPQRFARDRS